MSRNQVQLQADLPNLSSLVANMGIAGLKKLAQAGVDVHTLLCMDEIAEVCPASLEYRKKMYACRQQQRKQSIWLYKVVEIGTASNFIADELLKTRAGENVVALLSTILPILNDDDCDSSILGLFESCHVDVDKTPGLAQLVTFRDAILSLTQKLAFKDKVWQYHILLGQLQEGAPPQSCTSVPGITTLVQIMLMLKNLVMESSAKYVLTYRGWQGAAWVIAYARYVLGLAVCVLKTQHDTVPMNGQYQDSRVFIYLFDQESRCELAVSGHVADLVMPTDSIKSTQWAIDLDNVNLRTLYLSDFPASAEAASAIVQSFALTCTLRRASSFQEPEFPRPNHYSMYCLPQLYRRTKAIVRIMGFHTGVDVEPNAGTWKEYFNIEEEVYKHPGMFDEYTLSPSQEWFECGLPDIDDRANHPLDWKGQRLLLLMFRLADAASCLAFSNWDSKFNVLSTNFLENGSLVPYARMKADLSTNSYGHTVMRFEFNNKTTNAESCFVQEATFIVLGTVLSRVEASIAFERQDVVVARAAATQYSISLDAVFIHFYPGQIVMLGQRRSEIRPCDDPPEPGLGVEVWSSSIFSPYITVHPLNGFPQMTIKPMLTLTRTSVEVTHTLVLNDRVFQLKGPTLNRFEELDVRVTNSCSHSYYSPAPVTWCEHEMIRGGLQIGPLLIPNPDVMRSIVFQAVDQSPCGQWASLYGAALGTKGRGQFNLLQRGMCTACTMALIRQEQDRWKKESTWFVIPAGPADEAENDQ
ncbi:MAG: hypothetical protein LQ349_006114 [Xanthoria aureola]|nr:MAG: hypothetical protein LQ349_006114 [Xanthoria aureola]